MTPTPQSRLAEALSPVPDGCRELLTLIERCRIRRRGERLTIHLEVDERGQVEALEVPRRFQRGRE